MDTPEKPEDAPNKTQLAPELESLSAELASEISVGGKPDIERVLAGIPRDQHSAFLRRLGVVAEQFKEGNRGRELSGTVRVASEHSLVDSASMTTDGPSTFELADGGRDRMGGYILESEVGRGGMGVVYRARHQERNNLVALKILPAVDGESLHRFKREFRSLADISHPNLIGLRSLETDGNQWFFTMELVENALSFRDFVRPGGKLNLDRLQSAMLQLCEGIQHLHRSSILHRDLKPSNVVVDAAGRVVILDFGLVSELKRSDETLPSESVSGTPAYMSPEAAGAGVETIASDWYSVGVMLYQAISGRLPFDGKPMQILFDKQSEAAPELQAGPEVPSDLCRLCMELIAIDPAQRPGYDQVRACLGAAPTADQREVRSDEDALLGRDWHLASLLASYRKVAESKTAVATFVRGKSGEGKSILINHFLNTLKQGENVTLLSGRCYDRESVPFKALDGLIDALASFLRTLEVTEAAILLPDDIGFLASLFPVLTRVEVIAKRKRPAIDKLDERQIRKRAFVALRILLSRLSETVQLVLFCDDLQWGDADSAEALIDVLCGEEAPELLFIGSFRSDERDESPFLNNWDKLLAERQNSGSRRSSSTAGSLQPVDIEVGPLTAEHCRQLVEERLREVSPATESLAAELLAESQGNAFILSELLECLDVVNKRVHRIPLKEVIGRKLADLPQAASDLLHMLAVAGQKSRGSELLAACGNPPDGDSVLTRMRLLKLLRTVGDSETEETFDTYHDKIRETVYEAIGKESRARLHRQIMLTIESQEDALSLRTFDLAHHADRAGEKVKAKRFAILAAEQATAQLSPRIAVEQYEIAFRNSDSQLTGEHAFEFAEGFTNSLILIGEYDRADKLLTDSESIAQTPLQIARLKELRAVAMARQGQFETGEKHARDGLSVLGLRTPSSVAVLALVCGWQAIRCSLRGISNRLFPSRSAKAEQIQAINILGRLTHINSFSHGLKMVWATQRGLLMADRFREKRSLARMLTVYGSVFAVLGLNSQSRKYTGKSVALFDTLNDRGGLGEAICWQGINSFANGEHESAIGQLSKGIDILEALGNEWIVNLAAFHRAMSLYKLGRLDEAIVESDWVFQRCLSTNDSRSGCAGYLILRATDGEFDGESIVGSRMASPQDILATCNLEKGIALWHATQGRFTEAAAAATTACDLPVDHRLPNYHSFAALPIALNVQRRFVESLAPSTASHKANLKKAKKLAWKTRCISIVCQSEASFGLRECGEVNRLLGRKKRALRDYEKSMRIAEKQSAKYDFALSNHCRIKLLHESDSEKYDDELEASNEQLQSFRDMIDRGIADISSSFDSNP